MYAEVIIKTFKYVIQIIFRHRQVDIEQKWFKDTDILRTYMQVLNQYKKQGTGPANV